MFLKKFFSKLPIFLFIASISIIPNFVSAYSSKVLVGGQNIGIQVNSSGVLIVGFYNVNNVSPGQEANLKIGDRIIKINNSSIEKISDLTSSIQANETNLSITFVRDNKEMTTNLRLYKDTNNVYKTGIYVKDSIIGIGTLTFIDPNNNYFGALGHEISEKTTGKKFEIKDGTIFESNVTGIEKSERNDPGEKKANYYLNNKLGVVTKNTKTGIYGIFNGNYSNDTLMEVASSNEAHIGTASFRTVIDNNNIQEFTINILKINRNETTKNIYFEITDKTLLSKTNGIVQGMSGSPIIQDSKIIGAVTHVVVDDSSKGYGIFITSMLNEIEN